MPSVDMNEHLYGVVRSAFDQLLEQSQTSHNKINQHASKVKSLRVQLQAISPELALQDLEDDADSIDEQELALVQNYASHNDCKMLAEVVETISDHLDQHQPEKALALLKPLASQTEALRLRLEYVQELKGLLDAYQQEKAVKHRLSRVVEALELSQANKPMHHESIRPAEPPHATSTNLEAQEPQQTNASDASDKSNFILEDLPASAFLTDTELESPDFAFTPPPSRH